MKKRVLFLCTGNSCRSQMAEGLTRYLWPALCDVASAGIVAHGLNPQAVKVMSELGIDISGHRSKTLSELDSQDFDLVITVCGHANESCPVLPGRTRKIHQGFDDPPRLAESAKSPEQALEHYRRVRDEIAAFVKTLPSILNLEGAPS